MVVLLILVLIQMTVNWKDMYWKDYIGKQGLRLKIFLME